MFAKSSLPTQRLIAVLLVCVQALGMGLLYHRVLFPLLICGAALLAARTTWRFDILRRRGFAVTMIVAVAYIFVYMVFPPTDRWDVYFPPTPFAHVCVQYVLTLQVLEFLVLRKPDRLSGRFPALGAAGMMALGVLHADDTERFLFQLLCLGFVAGLALFYGSGRQFIAGNTARPGDNALAHRARLWALGAMGLAMVGFAWSGAYGLFYYERDLESLLSSLFSPRGNSTASIGFSSQARLGSVAFTKSTASQHVALIIFADEPPGYLRGKVFDVYGPAEWISEAKRVTISPAQQPVTHWFRPDPPREFTWSPPAPRLEKPRHDARDATSTTATLVPREATTESPQAHPSPPNGTQSNSSQSSGSQSSGSQLNGSRASPPWEIWTEVLPANTMFAPLGTHRVSAFVDEVSVDEYGIFRADALTAGSSYHTQISRELLLAPPTQEQRERLLQTPLYVDPRIEELAQHVVADCATAAEKIRAVEQFFHTNYRYQLGIQVPSHIDPLTWFLLEKPPAHCEYFAAGAAILLRLAGVPCRYVTGFVALEYNSWNQSWMARNRDAHAWVEAYDDQSGWVIVEATPQIGVPSRGQTPVTSRSWDGLTGWLQRMRSRLQHGGMKWVVWSLLQLIVSPRGWLVLALVLLGVSQWKLRRRSAARQVPLDPHLRRLHELLRQLDTFLVRHELERLPDETLHQFAHRLEQESGRHPLFPLIAEWYCLYATLRYSGPLDDQAVSRLVLALPQLSSSA